MPRGTFETIYGRIPMNQLANINQNDPWFGLGYLLAQGYNRAYEQRGVDKGIEAGQEIINNIGNNDNAQPQGTAEPASDELYNSAISSGALAERNNPYPERDYRAEAARNVLGNNGIVMNSAGNIDLTQRPIRMNDDGGASTVRSASINENGKEVLIPTIGQNGEDLNMDQAVELYRRTGQNLGRYNSVGEANQAAQNIHDSEQRRLGQQGPTREQIKQDTLGYFVNKYSNSPNPDGDAAEARSIATAAEQGLQRINALAGFNKTQTRQQIMDRLIADGRPLSQREAIMEQLDPVLDAKEKSVNDELFNFYNSAYNDRVRVGDYAGAQALVPRMAKYNSQLAAAAVAGVPTIRDMYNEANKEKNAEAQHERDIEMANIRGQNARALFDYKNQAEFNNRYRGLKALMPELPDETIVGMALTGFNPFSGNGSGSRSGGSGRGGGTSDTTRLNAIKEEIDMYDSWRANNDPNTAYPRQDQLNAATSELSRLYGYDPQAVSANPNYYSIMSGWTDTLKQAQQAALNGEPAPSRAALERVLRQEAGDMADQILNETDWEAFGFGGNSGNNSKGINGGSGRTAGGFR